MATDDFNRTNTYPGPDLSNASWTLQTGSFCIFGNAALSGDGTPSFAFWADGSFTDDQYSEIVVFLPDDGMGSSVRMSGTGTRSGYYMKASALGWTLYKVVSNTETSILTGSDVYVATDTMRLEITGTGLTVRRNGSSVGTVTDSAVASGRPGMYSGGPSGRIDSWAGVGTGSAAPSRRSLSLLGVG